jgi:hypothetical protein
MAGRTDAGAYVNIPVTNEGHLEVAIHAPRNPFGSLHVESQTPILQHDAVYGIDDYHIQSTTNATGTLTQTNSIFTAATGSTVYGYAALQSRPRLRYRPGQGVIGRFTAMFTAGVANSYQVAGFGHAEDGVYFGYKGTEFGIIYNRGGRRAITNLVLTVASAHAENITRDFGRRPETFDRAGFEAYALEAPVPSGTGFPAPMMMSRSRVLDLGGYAAFSYTDDGGFTDADLVLMNKHVTTGGVLMRAPAYFYHLQRWSALIEQTKAGR